MAYPQSIVVDRHLDHDAEKCGGAHDTVQVHCTSVIAFDGTNISQTSARLTPSTCNGTAPGNVRICDTSNTMCVPERETKAYPDAKGMSQ